MTSVLDSVARCEIRQPAPPGDYVARFCYGVQGRLKDPACVTRPFTVGDREVVLKL
jgi:hypothetical protein